MTDIDAIKKLPVKDRIKKLKEYAEQKDKEKKEAEVLLKKSSDEVAKENEELKTKERIPIPQLASAEDASLSEEEKQLFRVHRFKQESKEEDNQQKQQKQETKDELELEAVVNSEKFVKKEESDIPLAQQPVRALYAEVGTIYRQTAEQGYMSRQQFQRVEYINRALSQKELSDYVPPTKEASKLMDIAQQRAEQLQGMYNKQKEKGDKIRHGYSFKDEDDEPRYKT